MREIMLEVLSTQRICKLWVIKLVYFLNLFPQVLPLILPFDFGEEPFDSGNTASVSCIVTKGDVPIDIGWLFNGRRIDTNDGVLISKSGQKISILSFEYVHSRHAGQYSCLASNQAGSTEHTAELKVMGNLRKLLLDLYSLYPKSPCVKSCLKLSFSKSYSTNSTIRVWRRTFRHRKYGVHKLYRY